MLLNKWTFGNGGGAAIWQIAESEEELLALLASLQTEKAFAAVKAGLAELHNPSRRREWLAVRMLVAQCLGNAHIISYESSGRPFLADGSWQISISHTKEYAALAWLPDGTVGIDIERRTDRVMRVVRKFINAEEQAALDASHFSSPDGELLLWTAKEALYKAVGIRELDCMEALTVHIPSPEEQHTTARCTTNGATYKIEFLFAEEFVCSLARLLGNNPKN